MNNNRINLLNNNNSYKGPVVYWMSREQRINFNHGMSFAQSKALEMNVPLIVVFCMVSEFINATLRQYDFMIKGLIELKAQLKELNIDLVVLSGNPENEIVKFTNEIKAGSLVTDFDPLKIKKQWRKDVNLKINIPFYEVDSHNIVPARFVSNKQEYGAYTLRPKINKLIDDFLFDIPSTIIRQNIKFNSTYKFVNKLEILLNNLNVDKKIKPVSNFISGVTAAQDVLDDFINNKLIKYNTDKNDPTKSATSNLSPYLHFGQISSQEIALKIRSNNIDSGLKESFLEELIVRKELSDNYCLYNENYDNFQGLPEWARNSLEYHSSDERDYIYTFEDFENSITHDDLWNACQNEMRFSGKMHGYLRMYWAKKILEWSFSPKDAIETALFLNNKYSLDGNDPNSYTGVLWSIGGLHDRAWGERKIFGKIRYMNYNGCKNKFDVKKYIQIINEMN